MLSCFGSRRRRPEEEEPLLPRYEDDTARQSRLREKLHTYQMIRAVGQGFLPSTEQIVVMLRTALASDVLNPSENDELSEAGQALVHLAKKWLKEFIQLVQNKNGGDNIQDFIWFLSHSRVEVDMEDVVERVSTSKAKAETRAVHKSIQTVGSLLLTNSEFQHSLQELSTVLREVFRDTAFTVAKVSEEAGQSLDNSSRGKSREKSPSSSSSSGGDDHVENPVKKEVEEALETAAEGATTVVQETAADISAKFKEEEPQLLDRLKAVVQSLRQKKDYSKAASTLANLTKQYLSVYARLPNVVGSAVAEDIQANKATEKALDNFWAFMRSFGDAQYWQEVEKSAKEVSEEAKENPEFESLVYKISDLVQDMLMDPEFFDDADKRFRDLRETAHQLQAESSLRTACDEFLEHLQEAVRSIANDQDVQNLVMTSKPMVKVLFPRGEGLNAALMHDLMNHFASRLIQGLQNFPIPRLEVAAPEIDLLLENIILQPGQSVGGGPATFQPFRFRVETRNNVEIRKARFRTTATVESLMTIKIDGLTLRADDFSFWLRAHSGILRLIDEGIASFSLDERGFDIHLDVEIIKDHAERVLSLRHVCVRVHHLNYKLRKSKFTAFAWLFKPLLRPLLRKVMEIKIASAIEENLRLANRELVFARERLRATRIADPGDLGTFIRAVAARMQTRPDPDVSMRLGIRQPGEGVFEGVYTPGSLVKVWEEEAVEARKRVKEFKEGGWRNDIFDVPVVAA